MSKLINVKPYNSSDAFRKDQIVKSVARETQSKSNAKVVPAPNDTIIEIGYCINTHGLSNIFISKRSFFKLFWMIITIVSAGLAIYFIQQTVVDFLKYNVMTEVRIIDAEKGIEFPVIIFF